MGQLSFPEIDHSANVTRIVSVTYTIALVVELNFYERFGKDCTGF